MVTTMPKPIKSSKAMVIKKAMLAFLCKLVIILFLEFI